MEERVSRKLRIGVAGLGRAFAVMLPTFQRDPRVVLIAAADPRPEARARFEADFGGRTYGTVKELCDDHAVDIVYIATPHQHHAEHACLGAAAGKHLLVEKPMALSLDDATEMIEASARAGVHLIVGHSHSFDAPILKTRALIESGAFGAVRMITAVNYTDFLYRPRRPEELDTARGGGALFNQAPHQIDIVRLIGGGRLKTVRAQVGAWDRARSTEGAYAALLTFEDGTFATLSYNGYGHFDSDELQGWIGEMGQAKARGAAKRAIRFTDPDEETAVKAARNYGGSAWQPPPAQDLAHQHFGTIIVSCERADLRPLPNGVAVYDHAGSRLEALPLPSVPRAEVIDELYDAVVNGCEPLHDGRWGRATLEACCAILQSAREARDIALCHQVPVR